MAKFDETERTETVADFGLIVKEQTKRFARYGYTWRTSKIFVGSYVGECGGVIGYRCALKR